MSKVRLGDYVEVDSGYAFKSKLFNDSEGIPIIRIRDVNAGISNTYYSGEYSDKYIVNDGDLLITMDGEFKIREWYGGKALLNQRVCRIRRKTQKLNERYLLYLLPKVLKDIEDKTPFVTVKHLSVKEIVESLVYIPNITTQNRIVEVLDIANDLINKRKTQIVTLSSLTQSIFFDMFGDQTSIKGVKISELIHSFEAGLSTGGENREKQDGEYGVLTVSAVTKGIFNSKAYKVPTKEINVEKKLIHPTKQSILVSRANTRELVGASCIVEDDYPDLFIPDKIWKINLKLDYVNPYYFITFIQQEAFRKKISKEATGTSGSMLNISQQKFKDMEIPLPCIDQQNSFACILNEISRNKIQMENSLIELENNFNSLVQQAFKGQLFNDHNNVLNIN